MRVLDAAESWREELDVGSRYPAPMAAFWRAMRTFVLGDKWKDGGQPKSLRMEYFYREMRRRTGYLMDDGEPGRRRLEL
jgi:deoxyribodipyrimidine photolyase-related protein